MFVWIFVKLYVYDHFVKNLNMNLSFTSDKIKKIE